VNEGVSSFSLSIYLVHAPVYHSLPFESQASLFHPIYFLPFSYLCFQELTSQGFVSVKQIKERISSSSSCFVLRVKMKKRTSESSRLDRKTVERNRRIHMKDLCLKLASLLPPHLFKPSKVFLVSEEARYDLNT